MAAAGRLGFLARLLMLERLPLSVPSSLAAARVEGAFSADHYIAAGDEEEGGTNAVGRPYSRVEKGNFRNGPLGNSKMTPSPPGGSWRESERASQQTFKWRRKGRQ